MSRRPARFTQSRRLPGPKSGASVRGEYGGRNIARRDDSNCAYRRGQVRSCSVEERNCPLRVRAYRVGVLKKGVGLLTTDCMPAQAQLAKGAPAMSEPRKTISSPPAYRPADLAERWGVSLPHVHNLIRKGELRAFRIGTLYRISAHEVERVETPPPIVEQPPAKKKSLGPDIWIPPELPPRARRK